MHCAHSRCLLGNASTLVAEAEADRATGEVAALAATTTVMRTTPFF